MSSAVNLCESNSVEIQSRDVRDDLLGADEQLDSVDSISYIGCFGVCGFASE